MNNSERRLIERKRRAERVRKSIAGTPERPRLCAPQLESYLCADY